MLVAAQQAEAHLDDPDAFRAFYEQTLPRLYTYFYHRCGGRADVAEDLTQETFLAAVEEIKRHDLVALPEPWILGIARHKLLDHFRRQQRAERAIVVPLEDDLDEPIPANAWEAEDARELAIAALACVPTAQREALILRYLDGFSVDEVAGALDRSVHAVESLLVRGKASFRRCYLEADRG